MLKHELLFYCHDVNMLINKLACFYSSQLTPFFNKSDCITDVWILCCAG